MRGGGGKKKETAGRGRSEKGVDPQTDHDRLPLLHNNPARDVILIEIKTIGSLALALRETAWKIYSPSLFVFFVSVSSLNCLWVGPASRGTFSAETDVAPAVVGSSSRGIIENPPLFSCVRLA